MISDQSVHGSNDGSTNAYALAYTCLVEKEPNQKIHWLKQIVAGLEAGTLVFKPLDAISDIPDPGRPTHPILVDPKDLPKRRLGSSKGHQALMHAIAHIEFNAINLAVDAAYRFQHMPTAFYEDWIRVAVEEAYHFQLLNEHLANHQVAYGDFPAHNGLWQSTHDTRHDVLVRMALVPRTLEARGLDVTPGMLTKLRAIGDKRGVEILKILLHDEIGHVAVGTKWFRYLCNERHLEPFTTFKQLIEQYFNGQIKGPFNREARQAAGFTEEELDWLNTHQTA